MSITDTIEIRSVTDGDVVDTFDSPVTLHFRFEPSLHGRPRGA
jgi:hypothetical protein